MDPMRYRNAVNPPFRMPVAYVNWGTITRAMTETFGSALVVAHMCDAVESVLCWHPMLARDTRCAADRSLTVSSQDRCRITVSYTTETDRAGYVCCSITRAVVEMGLTEAA